MKINLTPAIQSKPCSQRRNQPWSLKVGAQSQPLPFFFCFSKGSAISSVSSCCLCWCSSYINLWLCDLTALGTCKALQIPIKVILMASFPTHVLPTQFLGISERPPHSPSSSARCRPFSPTLGSGVSPDCALCLWWVVVAIQHAFHC